MVELLLSCEVRKLMVTQAIYNMALLLFGATTMLLFSYNYISPI